MSLFNANAWRVFERAGTMSVAVSVLAFASLFMSLNADARGSDGYGNAFVHMMQVRGPGMAEDRANERTVRQATRAQRQQQMEGQRAQRSEPINRRAPERELATPQAPAFRPPDAGDADRMGRPGRLTPDERRALRQQINQAGRDVYRPNTRP